MFVCQRLPHDGHSAKFAINHTKKSTKLSIYLCKLLAIYEYNNHTGMYLQEPRGRSRNVNLIPEWVLEAMDMLALQEVMA